MHQRFLRIFFISTLLLLSFIVRGQQYRIFIYNNLYGITDSNAVEAVAPSYDWVRTIDDREEYKILRPPFSSEAPTLKFNINTGSKEFFDRYYSDDVIIQNNSYSFVEQKERQYLINEKTGGILLLKEDFVNFENVGSRFLVAKFYPKVKIEKTQKPAPKKQPAKQSKRGAIPPPPTIERLPPPRLRLP